MKYTEIKGDDGQVWRLRFDLKALGWFEQQTEIRIMQDGALDTKNLYINDLAYLLAAALRHEYPDADLDLGFEALESMSTEQVATQLQSVLARDQGMELQQDPEMVATSQNGAAQKNESGTGTKRKRSRQKSA